MIGRYKRELSVLAAYFALLLILLVKTPAFFHKQFGDTCVACAPVLVAAVGMTLIILARHIDISIGSQFCICGVLAGLLAKTGLPMPLVIVCTLLAGALMGAVNGALVAGLGLPSIVATLATMVILREALRWVRQGEAVRDLPADFQWFGQSQLAGELLIVAIAVVVFLFFVWAMRWLMAGRAVYAIGSDQEAARLAGIHPARVAMGIFVLMGVLTALASVIRAVRFAQVDPNSGTGLELQAIAAVVVGGTAVSGGRGTLLGTLIGVALLGTVGAALGFLSGQAQWDRAIQGAIILIAVASDGLYQRGK
jgi:rhamnose transport system permease protein